MKKPITTTQALERLEELCACSEQCSFDLEQKMFKWGLSKAESAEVIDRLKAGRFLDEKRFVHAFVMDKYRFNRWGRHKIAAALAVKKFDRTLIHDALNAIDQIEYRCNCRELLKAKMSQMEYDKATDYAKRQKAIRYMLNRGYEMSLILELMGNTPDESDD